MNNFGKFPVALPVTFSAAKIDDYLTIIKKTLIIFNNYL